MKGYFLGAAVASLYISFFKNQVKPLVCTPLPLCWGGKGLSFQPIFQKGAGALTGSQFLEGVAGKEASAETFYKEGCSFYIKNKLKSQIFNNKKCLSAKMFLSLITKNLNWEI